MEKIPTNIKKEIEKLVREINEHNYRYYSLDAPVVSDAEYDKLFRRLRELEEQYHYILPDSPTQGVGAPPSERFVKIKHDEPMLSLENALSYKDVEDFDKQVRSIKGKITSLTVNSITDKDKDWPENQRWDKHSWREFVLIIKSKSQKKDRADKTYKIDYSEGNTIYLASPSGQAIDLMKDGAKENNSYNIDYVGDVPYTVEPKYDGLAMELTYINGALHHASTRGDVPASKIVVVSTIKWC